VKNQVKNVFKKNKKVIIHIKNTILFFWRNKKTSANWPKAFLGEKNANVSIF
jgi:hypothetical protein